MCENCRDRYEAALPPVGTRLWMGQPVTSAPWTADPMIFRGIDFAGLFVVAGSDAKMHTVQPSLILRNPTLAGHRAR